MSHGVTRREMLKGGSVLVAGGLVGCKKDTTGGGADGGGADGGLDATVDGAVPDGAVPDGAMPDAGVTGPWQLPAGHFVEAKMPLLITNPRPALELGPDSAYLWAHEGVDYEVPVTVIGGSWPYFFELEGAPAGMSIGQQLVAAGDVLERSADYGVVRWTPPAGSDGQSFSFLVRVTDQQGAQQTVNVALTVDNAKFVFVTPVDGNPSGVGSLADPLRGFAALWGADAEEATYAGRLLYFRGGDYVLLGGADTNNNVRLGGAYKPKVWRAFPGEQPILDCSGAKVIFNNGEMHDCLFDGLRWENGRQDVNNAHFIWATTRFDRGIFWRNYFYNLERGLTGNDNPAAIFMSAPTGHRQYTAVVSNTFDSMGVGGGNGVAGYDSYGQDYALFEDNRAVHCRSTYCLWLKGGHRWTTVRGERAPGGVDIGTVLLNIMCGNDGGTERSQSVEVSYCAVQTPASTDALRFNWATTADDNGPMWIYRCTVDGDVGALHADTAVVELQACVFTDADLPAGTTTTHTDLLTATAADLDAQLALTGTLRQSHLGTHGFEVAP